MSGAQYGWSLTQMRTLIEEYIKEGKIKEPAKPERNRISQKVVRRCLSW